MAATIAASTLMLEIWLCRSKTSMVAEVTRPTHGSVGRALFRVLSEQPSGPDSEAAVGGAGGESAASGRAPSARLIQVVRIPKSEHTGQRIRQRVFGSPSFSLPREMTDNRPVHMHMHMCMCMHMCMDTHH